MADPPSSAAIRSLSGPPGAHRSRIRVSGTPAASSRIGWCGAWSNRPAWVTSAWFGGRGARPNLSAGEPALLRQDHQPRAPTRRRGCAILVAVRRHQALSLSVHVKGGGPALNSHRTREVTV